LTDACEVYQKLWLNWQEQGAKGVPTADVHDAVVHIASCTRCLKDVSEILVERTLALSEDDRRKGLSAFLATHRKDGFLKAVGVHPKVAAKLARNPKLYRRVAAQHRAASRLATRKIPPEVAYTFESSLKPRDWVRKFGAETGYTGKGTLKKHPRISVEFQLDPANKLVFFNLQPVGALSDLSMTQGGFFPVVSLSSADLKNPAASVRIGEFKADIIPNLQQNNIRVILAELPEYTIRLPEVSLLSESGSLFTKETQRTGAGYETLFTVREPGNYVLVLDIIAEPVLTEGGVKSKIVGELTMESENKPPVSRENPQI
jgi:hypothetical protein